MAAKCSCRLQAFAHLQASQGKYHGAHSTYGPLPNNTKRRDSDGVLFFPDCPEKTTPTTAPLPPSPSFRVRLENAPSLSAARSYKTSQLLPNPIY